MSTLASLMSMLEPEPGWEVGNGTVYCDGMSLERLRTDLRRQFSSRASPVHVYSLGTLRHNVRQYLDALIPVEPAGGVLAYAVKANSNPWVVKALREAGVERATCVSGNEMKVALKAGFPPDKIILNGNGKRRWEVEDAIRGGSLLNVDSLFDAHQIVHAASAVGKPARVLLRLNPAADAHTHPYLSTALADSKFGVEESQVRQVLTVLQEAWGLVDVEGVHVHLGSAIRDTGVYAGVMHAVSRTLHQIQAIGYWPLANLVNLGGGLDIPHTLPDMTNDWPTTFVDNGTSQATTFTPEDLIRAVQPLLPAGCTLLLEPGRSLVATAGVVMTEVLGVKRNGGKTFVVVDAAMTEVIRPALYGARHPVTQLTRPFCGRVLGADTPTVDVVGPVCESSDVLARDCRLHPPFEQGDALLLWHTGAYCASMASNYNMRPLAMEVMIHDFNNYKVIRRPQDFSDIIKGCPDKALKQRLSEGEDASHCCVLF